jgi:hypothetical protein
VLKARGQSILVIDKNVAHLPAYATALAWVGLPYQTLPPSGPPCVVTRGSFRILCFEHAVPCQIVQAVFREIVAVNPMPAILASCLVFY